MTSETINIVITLAGMTLIPSYVWIVISIFNQRQELALIRQILDTLVKQKA